MLKIYVAGASAEMDRCAAVMKWVDEHDGMKLTHNWVESIRAAPVPDREMPLNARRHHARMDLEAIDHADLVWLLMTEQPGKSEGCWVELGWALKAGKMVIVSGPNTTRMLFSSHGFEVGNPGAAHIFADETLPGETEQTYAADVRAWEHIVEHARWYR